jgi:hypothetical protein
MFKIGYLPASKKLRGTEKLKIWHEIFGKI